MKIYTEDTVPYVQEYFLQKKPLFEGYVIWMVITLFTSVFIFISFAKFEEVIKISGTIRPEENISTISNAVTGRIKTMKYKSGQFVRRGEVLLEIDPTQLEAEKESLTTKIKEENEKLLGLCEIEKSLALNKNIIDKKHYEAHLRYESWIINFTKLEKIKKESFEKYKEEKSLPASMTTVSKLRELEVEYNVANNNYLDYEISFKHQIESEINTLNTSLKINNSRLKQIEDSLLFTKVLAPIDGFIQEIGSFNENDWIQSGQKLCNLIPDDVNFTKAEFLVPAKNAGKIERGMKVEMRFPSLPYHDFGGTCGNITSIDPDVTHKTNGEAYFLIKAPLKKHFLCDKTGKTYPLKVGLQVDARVILSKKTILNFLLEKIDF